MALYSHRKKQSMLAIAEAGLGIREVSAEVDRHGIVRGACARQNDRLESICRHELSWTRAHASAQHDTAIAQEIQNASAAFRSLLMLTFVIADSLIVGRVAVGTKLPAQHG